MESTEDFDRRKRAEDIEQRMSNMSGKPSRKWIEDSNRYINGD